MYEDPLEAVMARKRLSPRASRRNTDDPFECLTSKAVTIHLHYFQPLHLWQFVIAARGTKRSTQQVLSKKMSEWRKPHRHSSKGSHTESSAGLLSSGGHSTPLDTSKVRAQLLSVFLGHLVSLLATQQLPSPCILPGSWSNLLGLYTYMKYIVLFFCVFRFHYTVFHLVPGFYPNILSAKIPVVSSHLYLVHWFLAQGGLFLSVVISNYISECKASFPVLAFTFQPKLDPGFLRPTAPFSSGSHNSVSSHLLGWVLVPFLVFGSWGFPLLSCELSYLFKRILIFYPEFSDVICSEG